MIGSGFSSGSGFGCPAPPSSVTSPLAPALALAPHLTTILASNFLLSRPQRSPFPTSIAHYRFYSTESSSHSITPAQYPTPSPPPPPPPPPSQPRPISWFSRLAGLSSRTVGLGYRILRNSLALVGIATVLTLSGVVAIPYVAEQDLRNKISEAAGSGVLEIDLDQIEFIEGKEQTLTFDASSVSSFSKVGDRKKQISLYKFLSLLDRAATDPRITALYIHSTGAPSSPGLAYLSEIQQAISNFKRKANKPTFSFVESMGSVMSGTPLYLLTSTCDMLYIQPAGFFSVPGIATTTSFFKDLLEKIGVRVQAVARYEYKNFANMFTETSYTKYHREAMTKIIESLTSQVVKELAQNRNIDEKKMRKVLELSPMSTIEALKLGLIDGVCFRDQMIDIIREKVNAVRADRSIKSDQLWDSIEQAKSMLKVQVDQTPILKDDVTELQTLFQHFQLPSSSTQTQKLQSALEPSNTLISTTTITPSPVSELTPEEMIEGRKRLLHTFKQLLNGMLTMFQLSLQNLENYCWKDQSNVIDPVFRKAMMQEYHWESLYVHFLESALQLNDQQYFDRLTKDDAFQYWHQVSLGLLNMIKINSTAALNSKVLDTKQNRSKQDGKAASQAQNTQGTIVKAKGDQTDVDTKNQNGTIQDHTKHPTDLSSKPAKLHYVSFLDYAWEYDLEKLTLRAKELADQGKKNQASRFFTMILSSDVSTKDSEQTRVRSTVATPTKFLATSTPKKIALISLVGAIDDGAKNVRKAIRQASQDDSVAAIVLRIASPGGGVVQSEYLWRAVDLTKKPVVASFGNMAASGGFYAAASCDHIVSNPATLTGSIGVIFMMWNVSKALEWLGINNEYIEGSKNASYFTENAFVRDWTRDFEKKVNKLIDETYHDFVQKVATGRGRDYKEIHRIAKGRVWTGKDAVSLGLVDTLGGLEKAIDIAKEKAGLEKYQNVKVEVYPESIGFVSQLLGLKKDTKEDRFQEDNDNKNGDTDNKASTNFSETGRKSYLADVASDLSYIGRDLVHEITDTISESLAVYLNTVGTSFRYLIEARCESTLIRTVLSPWLLSSRPGIVEVELLKKVEKMNAMNGMNAIPLHELESK